ncbi:iron-containing redox enzyme family protein [Streptomyces sp. NPDC088725]|uniref:iron-containing redox enzyme family protein n=1 Tax=Streptomyces sp. NPDC088725 TaxID=3365873 RepID=UPI00382893EF
MSITAVVQREPELPVSRGELSAGVITFLRDTGGPPPPVCVATADPYGDDLQLALYVCYELHYRGFSGIPAAREWDPGLLRVRALLEQRFLGALRTDAARHTGVDDALAAVSADGAGVPRFLRDSGELWHLREYAAQRSLYHLKEADPHAWVLPRLWGRAKAGMAAVEFDEFGGGRADRVHARLFADLMADLGLNTSYGHYLDEGSAEVLATVNLMSLLGLHRALRGALVGHFAAVEIASAPGFGLLAQAMERTGAGAAAVFFYGAHVAAASGREQLVRREVVGGLLEEEPQLAADIAFGIDAARYLEDRLAERLLRAWRAGASSLRTTV